MNKLFCSRFVAQKQKYGFAFLSACSILLTSIHTYAYPIYDSEDSGIRRLMGYQNAQIQKNTEKLPAGALLRLSDVKLNLTQLTPENSFSPVKYDSLPVDEALKKSIDSIFKSRDPSYGVVVVDILDPNHVAWANINPDTKQNVGSVNKIVSMIGLFDALARAFPNIEDRKRILKTPVLAGDWVKHNEHKVPFFDPATGTNSFKLPTETDVFTLAEWIDHAISQSANAAGSVIWREAMLIRHFGNQYPVPQETADSFFKQTPKMTLQALSLQVQNDPMLSAGLDINQIHQGSFWTSSGKNKVPGVKSFATPRELMRLLLLMEQGKLVDSWSSLEMKRYLYMTKRRYRYAYAPELTQSAVFFKSGSLYQCVPEENFRCGKYMGNKTNIMNSVVIVESLPGDPKPYRYLAVLISNILKKNSAWDHSRLAAAIHEAVQTRATVQVEDKGDSSQIKASGEG